MALFQTEPERMPEARFAYTKGMFVPQKTKRGTMQFMVTLLYSKQADLTALHNMALACATGAWGDKAAEGIKSGLIKSPFLDGDGKQGLSTKTGERKAGFAGCTFLRVTSGAEFKPAVFDGQMLPIIEPAGFKSGWYGFPVLNCFAWVNDEQGKGITFGLHMAQLSRRGEILGGGGGLDADPEQYFEKIADTGPVDEKVKASGKGASSLFS